MKTWMLISVVVLGSAAAFATDKPAEKGKTLTIVSVDDDRKEFTVKEGQLVRLPNPLPAGATATVTTKGPIKHTRTAKIKSLTDQPLIGSANLEYEFKTTGNGKASITLKFSGGPVDGNSETYEVTVE